MCAFGNYIITSLRSVLTCIALASLSAFLIALTAATCTIATIAQQIPKQLDAAIIETRAQVLGQIADAEHDMFKRVDQIAARADGQLTATRADAFGEIHAIRELVNSRLGATLEKVDGALAEAHSLHAELRPTLENVAGVTAHANEASAILLARNALPAQILGVTAAAKVTLGETAQTMRVVRDSAPAIAASTIDTANSVRGVAADVHTATADFVKPTTFWKKVWAGIKTAGVLYVRTL